MIFSVVMCNCLWAQSFSGLRELVEINKDIKSKRISSYDRSGGNQDYLPINAGETREIFAAEGAGIITHIWVTINHNDKPYSRRNVILRMYWDGEESPSVESPIGDFFGQGWGEFYEYISLPLCAAPKEGKSMVSYFPMPYGNGARITIENDTEEDIPNFYYYVDYEEHKSIPENTGRFHAWWNHEVTEAADEGENEWELITTPDTGKNVTGDKNYLFMEAEGAGHFVGVNYYVNSPTPMWYGEGDDMFFI
ncbi:MAG: DUF2961 domain-containing protein, partial [Chloroflexi bacterium]|nr:DUF2961 domain-containing protein [Chloroflexota bacterium]